jgi:hypothetical protein
MSINCFVNVTTVRGQVIINVGKQANVKSGFGSMPIWTPRLPFDWKCLAIRIDSLWTAQSQAVYGRIEAISTVYTDSSCTLRIPPTSDGVMD